MQGRATGSFIFLKTEHELKLSADLQNKMVLFLHEHGAKATNYRLRQAMMIEYVRGATEVGIPDEFKNILWDFEELMEFFDLAEMELKK